MDLKNLLAFPACCQHLALFPIVYVYGVCVELLVVAAAEIAHVFVLVKLLTILVTVPSYELVLLVSGMRIAILFVFRLHYFLSADLCL